LIHTEAEGKIASRIAAADLFGRSAGDKENNVLKEDGKSTGGFWGTWWCIVAVDDDNCLGADGEIELMACDVDVRVRAWVINCFSFASQARFIREGTVREGAQRLFCAQMRLILSVICWIVGACVVACNCIGGRPPGGTENLVKET
jgi:hypothetical protein